MKNEDKELRIRKMENAIKADAEDTRRDIQAKTDE